MLVVKALLGFCLILHFEFANFDSAYATDPCKLTITQRGSPQVKYHNYFSIDIVKSAREAMPNVPNARDAN